MDIKRLIVSERPFTFITKSGLFISTIKGEFKNYKRQCYTAFGDLALQINSEIKKDDKLKVYGYFKPFIYYDHLKHRRERMDFIIKRLEKIV